MEWAENLLSTRRGTAIIGAGAALIAAVLLIVYLNRYRNSLKTSSEQATVLVAKNLIQKGAPGNLIGTNGQFQVTSVAEADLKDGAFTDPTALRGLVAAEDIYPGQQLTAADFAAASASTLQTSLTGTDRAISVPLDAAHGMIGQINPGDHVDVYVGLNVQGPGGAVPALKLLMQNALVLRTPTTGGGGTTVLRARGELAAALAYASDNGKLWLVLRPASGAKPVRPGLITVGRLLLGVRPVQ